MNHEIATYAREGGGMRWRVAELGMLWGHRGLSRANGRETRLDPFFPTFNFPSPFFFFFFFFFFFLFSCFDSQHFDSLSIHFAHMFSSPHLHATHEKSKIDIINFERRIPCYRIIIINPGFFLTLTLL